MKSLIFLFFIATLLGSTGQSALTKQDPKYNCKTEDQLIKVKIDKIMNSKDLVTTGRLVFEGFIPELIDLTCNRINSNISPKNDIVLICNGKKLNTIFEIIVHDDGFTWLPTAELTSYIENTRNSEYLGRLTCPM